MVLVVYGARKGQRIFRNKMPSYRGRRTFLSSGSVAACQITTRRRLIFSGCSRAPCKLFSRSVVALWCWEKKTKSLKTWNGKRSSWIFSCDLWLLKNCAWSSTAKLREYGPWQFIYWPHPLRSNCLSAATRVGLETGSLRKCHEVLKQSKKL